MNRSSRAAEPSSYEVGAHGTLTLAGVWAQPNDLRRDIPRRPGSGSPSNMTDTAARMTSVIVLGKGILGIQVAEWFLRSPNYQLQQVVPVIPEPQWTDSLVAWCRAHCVPVVESGHYDDIANVQYTDW